MPAKKTVKRTVIKKAPAKKPPKTGSEKTSSPKQTAKSRTTATRTASGPEKELLGLLKELSTDEITWLVSQARTMIYNHKVEEVNQAARELVDVRKRHASDSQASSNKKKAALAAIDIEPTGNGKSFNIIMGNTRLFLNLNELKALVKISQLTDDPADASARLFRWMDRERRDMILDGGFASPGDPRLGVIFRILREKFTVS